MARHGALATELLYLSSASIATGDVLEAVRRLAPITRRIELSGGCRHDPQLSERLLAWLRTVDCRFLVHSYFPPPRENFVLNFADTGEATRGFVAESMRFVQLLGAPYYSVHAGFRTEFSSDGGGLLHQSSERVFTLEGIEDNARWFRSRWPSVPLVLENLYPNNGNTACGFLMNPVEMVEALERMPEVGLLLDLGHLKISAQFMGFSYEEAVEELFGRCGERICEIHLSENDGLVDDHYAIGAGSDQLSLVRDKAAFLRRRGVRLTIEARGAEDAELEACYRRLLEALGC